MLWILLLSLLLYFLKTILMEKTNRFYRDLRFWLVLCSLIGLLAITVLGYPWAS